MDDLPGWLGCHASRPMVHLVFGEPIFPSEFAAEDLCELLKLCLTGNWFPHGLASSNTWVEEEAGGHLPSRIGVSSLFSFSSESRDSTTTLLAGALG